MIFGAKTFIHVPDLKTHRGERLKDGNPPQGELPNPNLFPLQQLIEQEHTMKESPACKFKFNKQRNPEFPNWLQKWSKSLNMGIMEFVQKRSQFGNPGFLFSHFLNKQINKLTAAPSGAVKGPKFLSASAIVAASVAQVAPSVLFVVANQKLFLDQGLPNPFTVALSWTNKQRKRL